MGLGACAPIQVGISAGAAATRGEGIAAACGAAECTQARKRGAVVGITTATGVALTWHAVSTVRVLRTLGDRDDRVELLARTALVGDCELSNEQPIARGASVELDREAPLQQVRGEGRKACAVTGSTPKPASKAALGSMSAVASRIARCRSRETLAKTRSASVLLLSLVFRSSEIVPLARSSEAAKRVMTVKSSLSALGERMPLMGQSPMSAARNSGDTSCE